MRERRASRCPQCAAADAALSVASWRFACRHAPRVTCSYLPNTFNYSPPVDAPPATHPSRAAWIDSFRRTTGEFQRRAASDPAVADAPAAAARFAARFTQELAALEDPPPEGARRGRDPRSHRRRTLATASAEACARAPPAVEARDPLCCLKLCALRDGLLREEGFYDCFKTVKAEENTKALTLLPALLAELDALPDAQTRLRALIEGVFAGNIFDLGAANTAAMFAAGGVRRKLAPVTCSRAD